MARPSATAQSSKRTAWTLRAKGGGRGQFFGLSIKQPGSRVIFRGCLGVDFFFFTICTTLQSGVLPEFVHRVEKRPRIPRKTVWRVFHGVFDRARRKRNTVLNRNPYRRLEYLARVF